jgi:putative transposase
MAAGFVWNECVAESRRRYKLREECGLACLQPRLAALRSEQEWLRAGSSVAQQQTIRDFAAARGKALQDIKDRLPIRKRRGMPKFCKRGCALTCTSCRLRLRTHSRLPPDYKLRPALRIG